MSKSEKYIISICEAEKIGRTFIKESKIFTNFTYDEFEILRNNINIYDARDGGIIIGDSHDEGGIQMIQECGDGNFCLNGEIEGGEYIYPIKHDDYKVDFLRSINSKFPYGNDSELNVPKDCNVIDVSNEEIQVILISKFNNYIINKQNTKAFINQIVNIINDK